MALSLAHQRVRPLVARTHTRTSGSFSFDIGEFGRRFYPGAALP